METRFIEHMPKAWEGQSTRHVRCSYQQTFQACIPQLLPQVDRNTDRMVRLTSILRVDDSVLVDVATDDFVLVIHNSITVGVTGQAGIGRVHLAVTVGVAHDASIGRVHQTVAVDICGI